MSRIELVDAQLARVVLEADRVSLHLSTAPAWRVGEGADARPVPGHQSGVTLVFDGATPRFHTGCKATDCIGAVREARLLCDGQAVRDLAVPSDLAGAFSLDLSLRNGAGLQVTAQRLRLTLAGDSRFIESMAC